MLNSNGDVAFGVLCLSTVFIWIKVFVTTFLQSMRINRPPEDIKFGGPNFDKIHAKKLEKEANEYFPQTERWKRIMANDCENVVFGVALSWAAFAAGMFGDPANDFSGYSYFYTIKILSPIMAVARGVHTYAYAHKMQPLRTICHSIFLLTQIGFCILLVLQGYSHF